MTHKNRAYIFQYLNVMDQHTNEQLGFLADSSKDGLMFITNTPPSLDKKLDINVSVYTEKEGGSIEYIKAQIQTLWVKPNINPKLFCVGCQILEIDPNDRQRLKDAGNTLGFDSDVSIHRVSS